MQTITRLGARAGAVLGVLGSILCVLGGRALAQEQEPAQPGAKAAEEEKEEESPWLLIPTFSVSPKLGASFGAIGAYLHYFDEKSRPSMFGVGGQYTTTESAIASLFTRASWDEDNQRVKIGRAHV